MAGEISINQGYVRDRKGNLKIVEILLTCTAFACMAVANNGFGNLYKLAADGGGKYSDYSSCYGFFMAFHIIGFMVSIAIFVVHLLSLQESLGSAKIWNILNLVSCVLLLILCAASGALMIKFADFEYTNPLYSAKPNAYLALADLYKNWRRYTDNRIAAIAFSFMTAIAFIVDAIFQLLEVVKVRGQQSASA